MLHISVHVVSCLCIRPEEEEELCSVLSTVRYFPFPDIAYMRKRCLMNRADHSFSDATVLRLKMLIGFCTAGLAGSPASWKPAWKAVVLSYALLTHLARSSGYPSFCDDRTLLASPTYQGLASRLVSRWMRCPIDVLRLLVHSFASSFLDLVAVKLPACPEGCWAKTAV